MVYEVNDKRKKEVIAEIKHKRRDKVAIPYTIFNIGKVVCWLVFLIPTVIGIAMAVKNFLVGLSADAFFYLVFILLGFIAAMALMIIPASIRTVAIRKYLIPWVPKTEERVLLTEKAIEHGFYNKYWGEYFYTFKIRYNDVVRIEYDEEQCLLRVYGPKEERWWTSADGGYCHDKFPANYQDKEGTWLEIPTYFEGFEELKKELEERTGKVIENKARPFLTYK